MVRFGIVLELCEPKGLSHSSRRDGSRGCARRTYQRAGTLRVALVSFVLLFGWCGSSYAENFKFDPATCKHNAGSFFYVALGRYVFATPGAAMANVVIDPISESRLLKVPDPSDPKGCFGNPLQSDSHALFHAITVEDAASGKRLVPDLLTLYNLDRGSSVAHGTDKEWPGEQSERKIAEGVCKRAASHEDLDNGLVACGIKPADPPYGRQEDWPTSYIAKPEIYATPLGKPFVINCGSNLASTAIDHCDVAYAVYAGVGVSYRFRPYYGGNPIPINQAIKYDKSLREAIGRALVKDYPWPK